MASTLATLYTDNEMLSFYYGVDKPSLESDS